MFDEIFKEKQSYIIIDNEAELNTISNWLEDNGFKYAHHAVDWPKKYYGSNRVIYINYETKIGKSRKEYLWLDYTTKNWNQIKKEDILNLLYKDIIRRTKLSILNNKVKEFFTAENFSKNNIVIAARTEEAKIRLIKLLLLIREKSNLDLDKTYWLSEHRYINIKSDRYTQGAIAWNTARPGNMYKIIYFEDLLKELDLEELKDL